MEPKLFVNVNFMNEFKQVLYFVYYLAYSQDISSRSKKPETPKDKFFDTAKISYMQNDILNNLQSYNFNLLEINNEDIRTC